MPKLPRYTARELAQLVEKHGFVCVRQSGSHRIYKNDKGARITIAIHGPTTLHPKLVKQALLDLGLLK